MWKDLTLLPLKWKLNGYFFLSVFSWVFTGREEFVTAILFTLITMCYAYVTFRKDMKALLLFYPMIGNLFFIVFVKLFEIPVNGRFTILAAAIVVIAILVKKKKGTHLF